MVRCWSDEQDARSSVLRKLPQQDRLLMLVHPAATRELKLLLSHFIISSDVHDDTSNACTGLLSQYKDLKLVHVERSSISSLLSEHCMDAQAHFVGKTRVVSVLIWQSSCVSCVQVDKSNVLNLLLLHVSALRLLQAVSVLRLLLLQSKYSSDGKPVTSRSTKEGEAEM